MWNEEVLAGKTILAVKVKSPLVWLKLEGGGWIEIEVLADFGADSFIDAVVLDGKPKLTGKSEQITFPVKNTTQEEDEVTATRFKGDVGSLVIVSRSSYGYYGSHLHARSRGDPHLGVPYSNYWIRDVTSYHQ